MTIASELCHQFDCTVLVKIVHWQSRVEIEYYSVTYFDRVAAFKVLYLCISIKDGVQMRCVVASIAATACLSPTLNGSSEIQHFECSDAIEMHNGRTFDFYTGLPH